MPQLLQSWYISRRQKMKLEQKKKGKMKDFSDETQNKNGNCVNNLNMIHRKQLTNHYKCKLLDGLQLFVLIFSSFLLILKEIFRIK